MEEADGFTHEWRNGSLSLDREYCSKLGGVRIVPRHEECATSSLPYTAGNKGSLQMWLLTCVRRAGYKLQLTSELFCCPTVKAV